MRSSKGEGSEYSSIAHDVELTKLLWSIQVCKIAMQDCVEVIWGLEVRQVAYAFEDFEVGLRDGLVHLLCGFEGDVGVFCADDDEGGDGDAGEGF